MSLPFKAIVGIRVGPASNLQMLLGQESYPMACAELSLACLRIHDREPEPCTRGCGHTGVPRPALLPFGSHSAEFVALDLPLFFVLFLIPTLCTCSLNSVSLTCPSAFCDDSSLDSHSGPLLSLPTQEASLFLACSPILAPKCWHESTWTDASPWLTFLIWVPAGTKKSQ